MGQAKLSTALTWLRERERQRDEQVTAALNYIRWAFWVTVGAAVFVVGTFAVVIVVLVFHR
jgi:hypothetical protein